jgi:hypothetical protein
MGRVGEKVGSPDIFVEDARAGWSDIAEGDVGSMSLG